MKQRPADVPCSKTTGRWILAATILGSSMAFIDGTVVNVALAALQRALKADVVDVQWVVEAYSLFLAAFLLLGGSLGDAFGRRRIFLIGVSVFALASAWCGFTPTIRQLIIARSLQGLGAALLVPGSLAIISNSFAINQRGRAIGTWSGFSAITAAIGPVVGGWLIEHVSWRAVFFINLPIAALVILISLWRVPETGSKETTRLDWPGAILCVLGLGTLIFGLLESSRLGFAHPSVVLPLVSSAMLLALFAFHEARSAHPMLPLALFRVRSFSGANLLTLLLYAALGGAFFFLPLNLIQVQGYSSTAAGAALLPFILIMFFFSRWSGGLVEKYGARIPLIVGPLIAAVGFALFVRPTIDGHYWVTFFPAVVVLGCGMTISVAPLTTTLMNSVPETSAGVASGINNAVARAAGLLAIALFGIVMLQTFEHHLHRRLTTVPLEPAARAALAREEDRLAAIQIPPSVAPATSQVVRRAIDESFVDGFRVVMVLGALLATAGGVSGWFLIRTEPPR